VVAGPLPAGAAAPVGSGGEGPAQRVATHHCAPTALAHARDICAAGPDGSVCFYDARSGRPTARFERAIEAIGDNEASNIPGGGVFAAAAAPGGDTVLVAGWDAICAFTHERANSGWARAVSVACRGMGGATAVAWRPDGAGAAVGTATGLVDAYETPLRRVRHIGIDAATGAGREMHASHVSRSRVVLRDPATGRRLTLGATQDPKAGGVGEQGARIVKVITRGGADGHFLVVCRGALLVGSLASGRWSEISPWRSEGGERLLPAPDYPGAGLIHAGGRLSVVEYGRGASGGGASAPGRGATWSCRTEHASPHLCSLRLTLSTGRRPGARRLAYLIDAQTVRVVDLGPGEEPGAEGATASASASAAAGPAGRQLCTVAHARTVRWLELSPRGDHCLLKDTRGGLHVVDCTSGAIRHLASGVAYCQWAPAGGDVIVAQAGRELIVWYGPAEGAERTSTRLSEGAIVVDIVRDAEGCRVVAEAPGGVRTHVALDGGAAAYDEAMEAEDWWGAAEALGFVDGEESHGAEGEAAGRWRALGDRAAHAGALAVAEMAYGRVGDLPRARYLGAAREAAAAAARAAGVDPAAPGAGVGAPGVIACLAALRGDLAGAEAALVSAGDAAGAVRLYDELGRREDAVRLARRHELPGAADLERDYLQWLIDSRMEVEAATIREREGDIASAASLYLRGGAPARAAALLAGQARRAESSGGRGAPEPALVTAAGQALERAGLHAARGDLLLACGDRPGAMAAYRAGGRFDAAARLCPPEGVAALQAEWGRWHADRREWEAAATRLVEGGEPAEAARCLLRAGQWARASAVVRQARNRGGMDDAEAAKLLDRCARALRLAGDLDGCERLHREAGRPRAAWRARMAAGDWAGARRVAGECFAGRPEEIKSLYLRRAERAERAGDLAGAESLYLEGGDAGVDRAIAMREAAGDLEAVVRLTQSLRPDKLRDTRVRLAEDLEKEGRLGEAETLWAEAGEWRAAVGAYRSAGRWDDALRVAQERGGADAARRVAFARAVELSQEGGDEGGYEAGARYLERKGLVDQAIDYALEGGAYDMAFGLARSSARSKLPEVDLKYAMHREDEGDFDTAERHFIAAGRPREAVELWTHQREWARALAVAEAHDSASVPAVQGAQATALAEAGDLAGAEGLWLACREPERAVEAHAAAGDWEAALRVASSWLAPHQIDDLKQRAAEAVQVGGGPGRAAARGGPGGGAGELGAGSVSAARAAEDRGDWAGASRLYLAITLEGADGDANSLQDMWERGVALADDWFPGPQADAAAARAARQLALVLRRSEAAGQILLRRGADHRSAAETLAEARCWEAAETLASQGASQGDPGLPAHVQELRTRADGADAALARGGGEGGIPLPRIAAPSGGSGPSPASGGVGAGGVPAEVETLAVAGRWDEAHGAAAAAGDGGAAAAAVAGRHAERLVGAGDVLGAARTLAKHAPAGAFSGRTGLSLTPLAVQVLLAALATPEAIAQLGAPNGGVGGSGEAARELARAMDRDPAAHDAVAALGHRPPGVSRPLRLADLAEAAHWTYVAEACANAEPRVAGAAGVALLRVAARSGAAPADKALALAGRAWRTAADQEAGAGSGDDARSTAFVLLNTLLDIHDAVEARASTSTNASDPAVETADFEGTDLLTEAGGRLLLPPRGQRLYLEGESAEAEREWVLEASVAGGAAGSGGLPTRPCRRCGVHGFVGSLACASCGHTEQACRVTGFPLDDRVICPTGCEASRDAWNRWTGRFGACPSCDAPAKPQF